jgi:hypothetical protein
MKKIFRNIFESIRQKRQKRYTVKYVDDVPDVLSDMTIYIIGEFSFQWLISFKCPCGCERAIHLNLLKGSIPNWRYVVKNTLIDIYPSVRRIHGCKSHFTVRKGKIDWISLSRSY